MLGRRNGGVDFAAILVAEQVQSLFVRHSRAIHLILRVSKVVARHKATEPSGTGREPR